MSASGKSQTGDVPTVLLEDRQGNILSCFLEELIQVQGDDYALLTPVDTPVSIIRLSENGNHEIIDKIEKSEPILAVADVVLQEHDLTLVRSAVTLTVTPDTTDANALLGELEEPDLEELEEDELDDDSETYGEIVRFRVEDQEYGLFVPLDPFFVVAKMENNQAILVEGDEFDKIQPIIETALDEREASHL